MEENFESEEYTKKEKEYVEKMAKMLEETANHIFSLFSKEQQEIIRNYFCFTPTRQIAELFKNSLEEAIKKLNQDK